MQTHSHFSSFIHMFFNARRASALPAVVPFAQRVATGFLLLLLLSLAGWSAGVHAQLTVSSTAYTAGETALIQLELNCTTNECRLQQNLVSSGWTLIRTVTTGRRTIGVNLGVGLHSFRLQRCTLNANGSTAYCSQDAVQTVEVKRLPGMPMVTAPAQDADGIYSVKVSEVADATEYELAVQVNGGNWQAAVTSATAPTLNETRSNGQYGYRARACSPGGCSDYSAVVTVQVAIAPPVVVEPPDDDNDPDTPDGGDPGSDDVDAVIHGAVPPSGPVHDVPVGTLAGEFRVNEAGAATYAVALSLPQGTAGVTPQLSFNYSSQGGNGLLGQGWSLGGLSAITRCRQTLSQDGRALPVTWSDEDRFCLDGQRLMLVSGSHYGAVGATYKTEIDSFVEVTAEGGVAGHPDYFVVTAKDGSTSTYGATADARVDVAGSTFAWSLSRFADNVQNRIDFIYAGDADSGQRIARIDYAYPSPDSSSNPGARVEFDYEARPDPSSSYLGGQALWQTRRLSQVTISNAGAGALAEYRRYQLAYQPYPTVETGNLSRLISLEECVVSRCFDKTRFDWSMADALITATGPASDRSLGNLINVLNFEPIDINGDGRLDLVWVTRWSQQLQLEYALANADGGYGAGATGGVFKFATDDEAALDLHVLDYNGDGRQDVIVQQRGANHVPLLFLATAKGASWRLEKKTDVVFPFNQRDIRFGDLDSDGMPDAYYVDNNRLVVHHLRKQGAALTSPHRHYAFESQPTVLPMQGLPTSKSDDYWTIHELVPGGIGDFNGDGRADLLAIAEYYTIEWHTSATQPGPVGHGRKYVAFAMDEDRLESMGTLGARASAAPARVIDLNNDGLSDVLIHGGRVWRMAFSTGDGFTPPDVIDVLPENVDAKDVFIADVNRDGYPDLLRAGTSGIETHYFLPDTHRFAVSSNRFAQPGQLGRDHNLVLDIDGDGWQDLVSFDANDSTWSTVRSNQRGKIPPNLITAIHDGLGNSVSVDYQLLTGSDHYSRVDVGEVVTHELDEVCVPDPRYMRDDAPKICHTPVRHHINTDEFYRTINDPFATLPEDNDHVDDGGSPVLEIYAPMPVVTQATRAAPTADDPQAQARTSYYYDQLKFQAAGRGALGFRRLTEVEHQTGTIKETTYRQDWPFVGAPLSTEVRTVHGHLLSRAQNTWGMHTVAANDDSRIHQTYIKESVEESFDLADNGETQGVSLKRVTNKQTFDDYGNITKLVTTTEGAGETLTKTVESDYGDAWHQRFGRLLHTTVTTSRGSETDVRRATFTYFTSGALRGLLESETTAPETGKAFTVTYQYDAFGNKTGQVKAAADGTVRRSDITTYANGRYVVSTTNALGHVTSEVIARNHFGAPTQIRDIHGTMTYIAHDDMGLEYLRQDQTGAWRWSGTQYCGGSVSCPAPARYRVEARVAGGGHSFEYFDGLGRSIRQSTIGFDGTPVHVDTQYDRAGRIKRVSTPYFEGTTPAGWTENTHDILGRVVETRLPDGTSGGTNTYDGYATTITNALGQQQTELKDLEGRLIQVTDNLGGTIRNQYDLAGNLISVVTDAPDADPVTVRMCYDVLGNKIAMHDPDKGGFSGGANAGCDTVQNGGVAGWWTYRYNGIGELSEQTDAKGQTQTFTYDGLGRRVTRVRRFANGEIDQQTRWQYDGETPDAPAPGDLGNLTHVIQSKDGKTECDWDAHCSLYLYDRFGRSIETLTYSPGMENLFATSVVYDGIGRPYQQRDALQGLALPDSGTRTHYNEYGYASQTTDLASGEPLRRTLKMNAHGQVVEEERGNGAISRYDYDPYFGRLLHQRATVEGLFPVQALDYQWDALGNLTSRHNQSVNAGGSGQKNLRESFCYDGLNRLIKSHQGNLSGSCSLDRADQDVAYDGLGNITRKTGIGDYTYGQAAGPHAVTNAGGTAYTYDANGNMTSGDGRTLTYNSADQAVEIRTAGQTTQFHYDADGNRYQRVDHQTNHTVTTVYLGNVERIHVEGSNTYTWRKTVAGVLYTLTTDIDNHLQGAVTQSYLYTDHLGSTDVITDHLAHVIESQSFDAWGQRRNSDNWAQLSTAQLLGFTARTPRGYTGHEQLDSLGLIHMNGRIYDPKLARFLQADPFIQAATHTQSYNRYSYLWNNPLNATDPSGFFLKKLWKEIRPFVGAAVGIALVYFTGGTASSWFMQSWYGAASAGAISGGAGAAANGGNIMRGALTGAVSGAAFYGIGTGMSGTDALVGHATAGGLISLAQGGKFGHGFASAGLTKAFNINDTIRPMDASKAADAMRTAVAALSGGTISAITGGKFANGATTAALAQAVNGNNDVKRQVAAQERIEKARAFGIKRIDKLRGVVGKAIEGKKGALRQITKYFGDDAASNLSALDSNLANIRAELSTATITAGDPAYIAKRLAEGDTVGAWVSQAAHPDTIFYNPSLTSNRTYFSALLVHEAAHLAGFGHEYFQGAIAYGGAGTRGLAGSSGWSVTSNNASSYACAAYTRATDC